MDVAYNQHSHAARRKSRSTTNLNHLSLAPLTSKLPIEGGDEPDLDAVPLTPSYLQGKSAPVTPRLLSRSPGRSTSRAASTVRLPKSKSATHLSHPSSRPQKPISPTSKRHSHNPRDRSTTDSDWLLRAGALISSETRESKGQAWLISRASSTSLVGLRDADDEAFDRELALERAVRSHGGSRRHSVSQDDGDHGSPPYSRYGSRTHSRAASRSRSQLMTPLEGRASADGYFPVGAVDEDIAGPDFVNLDEALEAGEELDTSLEDEAYVRRLVKKGNGGVGTWFGSVLGVQLFSVEENSDESEGEESDGEVEEAPGRSESVRRLEAMTAVAEEKMPPPKEDAGGWHDAAWLLSVASKVLL
ncbi:hypothetical protein OQA88_11345 [Cercophora sp. LCS_1]